MGDRRVVVTSANLDDDELKLANWLANEPSEYREWTDNELLMFIYPSDLKELGELLVAIDGDWFTDGSMDMSYNGTDVVIDAMPIIERLGIEPSVVYPDWEDKYAN